MTMSEHTPGPWKETGNWYLESTGDLITFTAITAITPYRKVAAVITDTREIENWDEMRANAKLIATAPELLEALEGLARWHGGERIPGITIERLRHRAWKAIKKAKEVT